MLYKILGKHLEDDIKYFQVKKSPLLTFLIVCVGGVKAKLKDSVPPFHRAGHHEGSDSGCCLVASMSPVEPPHWPLT